MSNGGAYDYAFRKLEDFADNLKEHGNGHCSPAHIRQAFAAHCRKIARAMQACEWNDSNDGFPNEEELIMDAISQTELAVSVHDQLRRSVVACESMVSLARQFLGRQAPRIVERHRDDDDREHREVMRQLGTGSDNPDRPDKTELGLPALKREE